MSYDERVFLFQTILFFVKHKRLIWIQDDFPVNTFLPMFVIRH